MNINLQLKIKNELKKTFACIKTLGDEWDKIKNY